MNKQTFTIPEGCTEISVEQDGDKLIATFGKSSKFEPNQGDVCFGVNHNESYWICFIFNRQDNNWAYYYASISIHKISSQDDFCHKSFIQRLATPEESKKLFDALEKEGLQWDAENNKLVKMRWKPEHGDTYWFFNDEFQPVWNNWKGHTIDLLRWSNGNCFETRELVRSASEPIKQTLINFHNEN